MGRGGQARHAKARAVGQFPDDDMRLQRHTGLAVEELFNPSPVTLGKEHAIDALMDGDGFGAVQVLQLSSKLIPVSQVCWDHDRGL